MSRVRSLGFDEIAAAAAWLALVHARIRRTSDLDAYKADFWRFVEREEQLREAAGAQLLTEFDIGLIDAHARALLRYPPGPIVEAQKRFAKTPAAPAGYWTRLEAQRDTALRWRKLPVDEDGQKIELAEPTETHPHPGGTP